MKKTSLNIDVLTVETFEPSPSLSVLPGQKGTACWELCANDPTSNPDHDSCGAEICNG